MGSKQVIVIRKDLNMRKGKMVAQGAHASMKVLLDRMNSLSVSPGIEQLSLYYDTYSDRSSWNDWLKGKFTKICLSVDSEQELDEIYNKAKENGLKCAMIIDSGATEFNGVPTKTCCAIGPEWSDKIDEITGHLKLL